MKCIVVEDDPFWMSEVCNALATEGVEVFPAQTAAEGLRLLDGHPDAAMVIDIILPDQDGLEILRDARANIPTCGPWRSAAADVWARPSISSWPMRSGQTRW